MENNTPIIAKRVCSMLRVALFMLRKGMPKGKLIMGLNMMLKRRSKLAGKAITNLMFHHGGSTSNRRSHDNKLSTTREYEFSCSNTPNYLFAFNNKRHRHNPFFTCTHAPLTQEDDVVTVNAVKAVLENMVNINEVAIEASPTLPPGFGRNPMVRQLIRVTDSPFPLRENDNDHDSQVDKAAEDFIKRFYMQLSKQA